MSQPDPNLTLWTVRGSSLVVQRLANSLLCRQALSHLDKAELWHIYRPRNRVRSFALHRRPLVLRGRLCTSPPRLKAIWSDAALGKVGTELHRRSRLPRRVDCKNNLIDMQRKTSRECRFRPGLQRCGKIGNPKQVIHLVAPQAAA